MNTRRVFIGPNAAGKTRECIKLAEEFINQNLIVVGNLPDYDISGSERDVLKELAIMQYNPTYGKILKGDIVKGYSYVEQVYIRKILSILARPGEVLVLDDIDSRIPDIVLNDILDMLKVDDEDTVDPKYPELSQLWKHIIVTGHSRSLPKITSDDWSTQQVYYIDENNNVTIVTGGDKINEYINKQR